MNKPPKDAETCLLEYVTDTGKMASPNEVVLLFAGELARSFVKGEISEQQLYEKLQPYREQLFAADGGNAAWGLINSWGEYW